MNEITTQFLDDLWRGGKASYWWTAQDSKSHWFRFDGPRRELPNKRNYDVYFGVNPCRFVPAQPRFKRTKLSTIQCISSVYCDIDGIDDIASVTFPLPPSYIVASGGGYHCYWLLDKPFIVGRSEERLREAKHIQRSWVRRIPQADQGVCCLTRILRLPDTLNHKYKPAREVYLHTTNRQARYTIDELGLPPMTEPKRYVPVERPNPVHAGNETQRLMQHIHDTIAHSSPGQRNYDCYRMAYLAGRLVGGGYVSGIDAEKTLMAAAQANGVMTDRPKDTARTMKRGMDEGIADPYVIVRQQAKLNVDVGALIDALQKYEETK